MSIKVAINGFGRIGRLVARKMLEHSSLELVAVNDITDSATLAHLFKYDSVHGRYDGAVKAESDAIVIDGRKIKVLCEKDPKNLPWKALGVSIVVESTGKFTERAGAGLHLEAGARKVLISAPSKDPDGTFVMGVNDDSYDPAKHHVVSNASCTTNCLAPVAKVLLDEFGIVKGLMTTIHAYTMDQRLQDAPHKDMRRARAAAVSMIPTTTGAAKAMALVIPELKGKLDGYAMRVPTPNVSVVDLTVLVGKKTSKDEVNAAVKKAAEGKLKGILAYVDEPLVSIDFNHDSHSSSFDAPYTSVIDGDLVKVLAWYDNEWGYSCRTVDLVAKMAKAL
ncbi:type I glyceraldehyde-3-phosphate dehydrogenase [bacterium]|nr:type I glyceraldehyde-3-phosphate dehydrogenase [bacterium]